MTTEEIKAKIEKLKKALFYEEMADFMNWKNYYNLKAKIEALEKELAEREF